MKPGRNDLCPCGSGKKYKKCCLINQSKYVKYGANIFNSIRTIVQKEGYTTEIADILCNLLQYMYEIKWTGACHATTAVLYIALSELGFNPVPCIGEVFSDKCVYFDHSWIEIDGKIIDLACSMPLPGFEPSSKPIIFDLDSYDGSRYSADYGCYYRGLDTIGSRIMEQGIVNYMNAYPNSENGLWDIVQKVMNCNININELKRKYHDSSWNYVRSSREAAP